MPDLSLLPGADELRQAAEDAVADVE